MTILNHTQSICPQCQKNIPAEVFCRKGKVFIKSRCPEHGEIESDHVWDDPEIYQGLRKIKLASHKATQTLIDVTNKCNLNCKVCFARANEYKGENFKKEDLDELGDYDRIFISGGEPTIREDLPEIISRCRKNGQKPIIFSNGIKLADLGYAKKLKEAGLRSVLLQLDTLRENDCNYIRGKKLVKTKIKALYNLKKLGVPVSIWTVVVKDKNLRDLRRTHDFLFKFPNVKTVSAIPIWRIGRYEKDDFVPPSVIIKELEKAYPGLTKKEFIETTRLMCNIDRILIYLGRKKGRIFGICMIKSLIFDYKGRYYPLGKIFDLDFINQEIDSMLLKKSKGLGLITLLLKVSVKEILVNFLRNKYFRAVVGRFLVNLRFLVNRKYLLINPFHFITVGIYPSAKNIDLGFIRACNTYALDCDDHRLRPACLHYINQEKNRVNKVS